MRVNGMLGTIIGAGMMGALCKEVEIMKLPVDERIQYWESYIQREMWVLSRTPFIFFAKRRAAMFGLVVAQDRLIETYKDKVAECLPTK